MTDPTAPVSVLLAELAASRSGSQPDSSGGQPTKRFRVVDAVDDESRPGCDPGAGRWAELRTTRAERWPCGTPGRNAWRSARWTARFPWPTPSGSPWTSWDQYLPNGKGSDMMRCMGLLDSIRDAIDASGKTRYRIAQDSGIAESMLSRLMSGERGLSIDALERLTAYLDLEILVRPKKGSRSGIGS